MKLKIEVDESIIFWAFRYALGRATYAVSDVQQALTEHWINLPYHTRLLIQDEIRSAESRDGLGMEMDAVGWRKIKELKIE